MKVNRILAVMVAFFVSVSVVTAQSTKLLVAQNGQTPMVQAGIYQMNLSSTDDVSDPSLLYSVEAVKSLQVLCSDTKILLFVATDDHDFNALSILRYKNSAISSVKTYLGLPGATGLLALSKDAILVPDPHHYGVVFSIGLGYIGQSFSTDVAFRVGRGIVSSAEGQQAFYFADPSTNQVFRMPKHLSTKWSVDALTVTSGSWPLSVAADANTVAVLYGQGSMSDAHTSLIVYNDTGQSLQQVAEYTGPPLFDSFDRPAQVLVHDSSVYVISHGPTVDDNDSVLLFRIEGGNINFIKTVYTAPDIRAIALL